MGKVWESWEKATGTTRPSAWVKLVGNNLAQVMKDRGLTVLETARRSGVVTARQLFRIRDGQNCPSLRLSVALSVVLDTKIEDLFTVTIITRSVAS